MSPHDEQIMSAAVPTAAPSITRPFTVLACMGDAHDPQAWSSIPYHVLDEGRRQGVVDDGLRLEAAVTPWARRRRLLWNLGHVLTGHKPGGYQYSGGFLDRLWAAEMNRARRTAASAAPSTHAGGRVRVVNHFQLFPPAVVADPAVERWHYVDGTLRLLFDHYREPVDPRWVRRILAREGEGYRSAAGVMTMSRYAADSVVRDYGVDPAKVHVVVPGANVTHDAFEAFEAEAAATWRDPETGRGRGRPTDDPPRLVFVGRGAVRKGLDRLSRGLAVARGRGSRATLRVIGMTADDVEPGLREVGGVEWLGLVSRRTDTMRFCRLVAECDVGCLLSRTEMAGISLREFLAFGLAVVGPLAGGSPDQMTPDTSVGLTPGATDEEVATVIGSLDADRDAWDRRRAAAWAARREALWAPSLRRMAAVMAGGDEAKPVRP
jgi:glycosyltransferase involved in cell wall biosynthesis